MASVSFAGESIPQVTQIRPSAERQAGSTSRAPHCGQISSSSFPNQERSISFVPSPGLESSTASSSPAVPGAVAGIKGQGERGGVVARSVPRHSLSA